jgi:chromosome segregation ATPase
MVYSEKEIKRLKQEMLNEQQKIKKQNELLEKELRTLKKENKQKEEVIQDLSIVSYKTQYEELLKENEVIKKKLQQYEKQYGIETKTPEKDSSNSCKPSSTDGFKKIIQNNRIKTGRKPR